MEEVFPPVISFKGRCLIWDPDNISWIAIRPRKGGKSTIIEQEDFMEPLCQCWCGAKQFINKKLSQPLKDEVRRRFMNEHKSCGKRKNYENNETLIYNIDEEEK